MIINVKKLKTLKEKNYNQSKESLELIRYLESISYLYVSNEPIPNNIVGIPSNFPDELIEKIFLEISGEKPYFIAHLAEQKACYF